MGKLGQVLVGRVCKFHTSSSLPAVLKVEAQTPLQCSVPHSAVCGVDDPVMTLHRGALLQTVSTDCLQHVVSVGQCYLQPQRAL